MSSRLRVLLVVPDPALRLHLVDALRDHVELLVPGPEEDVVRVARARAPDVACLAATRGALHVARSLQTDLRRLERIVLLGHGPGASPPPWPPAFPPPSAWVADPRAPGAVLQALEAAARGDGTWPHTSQKGVLARVWSRVRRATLGRP